MVQPLNKDSEQMSPSYDTPSRSDTVGTSSHSSSDTEKDVEVDAKPVGSTLYDLSQVAPLAPASNTDTTPGASILQCLGIRRGHKRDLDAIATPESVFDGPLAAHYVPNDQYENKKAFDPAFRWTHREEAAVRRKCDVRILLWMIIMFTALNINRYNLSNATADNLLDDLGITHADYNLGNTLFRVGFLLAEFPSQIIGKKLGVDIWLPTQCICWSVVSGAQFWMKGRASFLGFRVAIAVFQGGFIPDAILYFSYYYTKHELPLRLALFWCINYASEVITGFLAAGILEMRGVQGQAGWQWYFLFLGLISLVIGVLSFFILAPGPSQTKAKWRPNGYFTENEVKIIVNKVLRDDPTKASMHNREALTLKLMLKSLKDFDLWPMYIVGLTFGIPGYPLKYYFQITMRQLGYTRLLANLLSIPNVALSIITLIGITVLSEVVDSRTWLCSMENWWFLPFYIALRTLPDPISAWVYFALATLILGFPYAHALQVAWCSRNSGSVRTRTFSAALYNMSVQVSGIIGANLYQSNDAPRYYKANSGILGVIVFNLVILYPATWMYYKRRNASKDRRWSNMTVEEQSHYLATTTDEGCKRLDFRFAY